MVEMKAVLLAAGRGSRMGRTTQNQPKCFTKLAGKKLIEWQKASLNEAGINEVCAIGGYCAELVNKEVPVSFVNQRWAETNSLRSLLCASNLLSNHPCVISYSDIVYHPGHVTALLRGDGDIRITYDIEWLDLWSLRGEDPLLDAESFRQRSGWLTDIGRKVERVDEICGQFMGLIYMTPAGWRRVCSLIDTLTELEIDRLDITGLLLSLIGKKVRVGTVPVAGRWCEVDTETDRDIYELKLMQKQDWQHDWRSVSTGKQE